MEYPKISSLSNSIIKEMKSLSIKKFRSKQQQFLAEGEKIIYEALNAGSIPKTVIFRNSSDLPVDPNLPNDQRLAWILEKAGEMGAAVFEVTDAVIQYVGDAQTSQGIIAAFEIPRVEMSMSEGILVALDAIQDPGNLGAIIRSADAMGASAVLLGNGCCDPYSPKCVRAAMGSTFHLPVVETGDLEAALHKLKAENFQLIAADLNGQEKLPEINKKVAILIGNEGNGLSDGILSMADHRFKLAMRGRSESLNAAVCTGILLYVLCENYHKT